MSFSTTWKAQPLSERSSEDKICAGCEAKAATLLCTRCHCTRYCSKECQRKHWKSHKKQCCHDPLYNMPDTSITVPTYREYTQEEAEHEHAGYILLPGQLDGLPTDDRDGYCRLVVAADDKLVSEVRSAGLDKQIGELGWTSVGTNPVMGYSYEDSIIFRLYYDDNFMSRVDLPENKIANTLVQSKSHRGKFLVVKCSASEDNEKSIPFTKKEIVDVMVWRLLVGRFGHVSSRMFRENMRKREFNSFLGAQGFKFV